MTASLILLGGYATKVAGLVLQKRPFRTFRVGGVEGSRLGNARPLRPRATVAPLTSRKVRPGGLCLAWCMVYLARPMGEELWGRGRAKNEKP